MIGALAIAGLFLFWMVAGLRLGWGSDRGWRLLRLISFSVAVGFVAYYRNVLDLIANHFAGLLGRLTGTGAAETAATRQAFSLDKLARKVAYLVGPAQVIAAAIGAAVGPQLNRVAWGWLGSWLAVGAFFALLDQVLGDAIRWYYLVAAAVALLAGRALGLLAQRGRLAGWLAALVVAALLWQLLNTWVGDMIFYRYHTR
jgi:hypothetical protein